MAVTIQLIGGKGGDHLNGGKDADRLDGGDDQDTAQVLGTRTLPMGSICMDRGPTRVTRRVIPIPRAR